MINTEEFTKRLQQIITYYGLSASSFADKIGVQRSSISHLLSGRNNPSLDFVMKILQEFPDVELYWLLNGKGEFPKTGKVSVSPSQPKTPDLFAETPESVPDNPPINVKKNNEYLNSEIERIVIFYKDGTFETYSNKN